jgi:acyl transferase domain-containing protein/NAD(P)H-dependent flavin oxidoreductase YrpB (nitropropane dioxygenase family)/NAD(P)-dependent dehydrogenase (short-subunit alcohol dehydrogenase family)
MTGNQTGFDLIGMTLPRLPDPAVAIAVSRAGGIGVLDLEWDGAGNAASAIQKLARLAKGRWGVKLNGADEPGCEVLLASVPSGFEVAILTCTRAEVLGRQIARLRTGENRPGRIFIQITDGREIPNVSGVDGFIAKGHEAGGVVGDETTFILLQRLLRSTRLPVWAQGGIGLHSVAACRVAGAAGVVLDAQLSLARESVLPERVRQKVARMDGSETVLTREPSGLVFRCVQHPGFSAIDDAAAEVGWGEPDRSLWPLGQDAAMASKLAERFATAGRIISAFRESAEEHARLARQQQPLAEGSSLAKSHATRFPIVQGPMTRVSDCAEFAAAVATGGALPFVALALFNEAETRKVLEETREALGKRPWGVGILGFVPLEVRTAQLNVIREVKPAFALIAGGRPDQALSLDREGIATYLHIPSPDLLKLFFEQGARRFVFEGRECGGHVGPRSSFVLWDGMIDALLSLQQGGADLRDVHVLFAGGIHDGLSASMASAMTAPLVQAGAKIGVLLGTAYLFTREAVETGAIMPGFQSAAVGCRTTALLESGPGHASRCALTPFALAFEAERQSLAASGASRDEARAVLEELSLGRLRIAAKGVTRRGQHKVRVDEEEQRSSGMYMLGQLAALREKTCSISELHEDVSAGACARLESFEILDGARNAARPSDIAIIGVATLMPKAADARRFWENILGKVDAIMEIPQHRFDWHQYYDPDPAKPDKIYSKWGGFLDDVVFDPVRYGMPPHALPSIEPMQLLTLEAVRAAIADAGYGDRPFIRSNTSVILGAGGGLADLGQQYGMRSGLAALGNDGEPVPAELLERLPQWTEDSFAGLLLNVAAGRVANRFDLGGVNFTVDAACASSLAAVYSGVRELESGSSDVVIAGGVDTVQNPFGYLCFSKTKALSPRGRCRPFDADADGIVISEGLAVLVMKRLADAERDGDRIYAVIKSVAGSSDGRDKGLTAPRPEGQVAALRRAYERAGISPATVGLIEAHGTGTVAGDLAEVEALKRAFNGSRRQGCAIGSVKSMVGHTKCAAGAAGLIKAAMALREKVLPPTLHVQTPNPKMDFPNSPFFVNTEVRPWIARPDGIPRRAGVSAFGFGGTNFHVVLEEYADDPAAHRQTPIARNRASEVLVWSADSPGELRSMVSKLIDDLDGGATPALIDLAPMIWRNFSQHAETCLAVVATGLADLRTKLTAVLSKLDVSGLDASGEDLPDPRGIYLRRQSAGLEPGRMGKIALLFPGQGSQHVDMLAELAVCFPEVRESLEEADRLLADLIPGGVTPYIYPPSRFTEEETARCRQALSQTEITQPAMGAACMAMLRLLESMGLRADVTAGHSYGEYVALTAAGVFSTESLYALSAARGKCLSEGSDPGTMLAVWERAERVMDIVRDIDGVWIANVNSPAQTVLSGTHEGVTEARERLAHLGIEARPVAVSCAFHSPLVARPKEQLAEALAATQFSPPQIPVFSNTTGELYPQSPAAAAALLSEHLTRPVRFNDEIEAMYRAGVRTFVEVGPRRVLTALVGQILAGRPHAAVALCGERSSLTEFLQALAQLVVRGIPISLDRLYEGRAAAPMELCQAEIPSGAWLVNGGRARRFGEPALRLAASAPVFAEAPKSVAQSPRPSVAAIVSPSEADAVMVRFQETMTRFLETQRQTMMAYLGHAGASADKPVTAEVRVAKVAEPAPGMSPDDAGLAAVTVSATATVSTAPVATSIFDTLRGIISDRTGYPIEMLDPALNLEADLGIDSIKRVEILGAFQRSCGDGTRVHDAMERLTALKTIGSMADALGDVLGKDSTPAAAEPVEPLPRFVVNAVKAPLATPGSIRLPQGAVLITDDGRGIALGLARELTALGWPGVVAGAPEHREAAENLIAEQRRKHGSIAGILHLQPLADWTNISWQRRLALETKGLFHLAKAAGRQRGTVLFAATGMGGDFGGSLSPLQGGVAGIVKTLALEWSDVNCRVVDFEADAPAALVVSHLLVELAADGPVETGYNDSTRVRLQIVSAPLPPAAMSGDPVLGKDPVILVTGGLRGITAKAALQIASRYRGTILAVGKSTLPSGEESGDTAGIDAPRELRAALIGQVQRTGGRPDPAAIEAAYTRLVRDREMRANLRALRKTGAEVRYLQCDLANADEFSKLLDEIYSSYGAIDGVIHGAGVIEDRLVEDKDTESFDRVVAAKVTGAMVLAERLKPETLRFLAFFSSVSGRFGNRGQADYAAANEVLNKLAAQLDARWPARVVAINWGPWDGSNMVGDAVRDQFVQRGVQLIEASAGCDALIHELVAGKKGETEVILGGGPWGETPAAELPLIETETPDHVPGGAVRVQVSLNPSRHRYLQDHCLDGRPVLPAAFAIELMAEAARKAWPDRVVSGVHSVRVCKGIVVDAGVDSAKAVLVTVRPPTHYSAEDRELEIDVSITDFDRPQVVYYRGVANLADRLPTPAQASPCRDGEFGSSPISIGEVYRDRLFHGPRFHCLARIAGLNQRGVRAYVTPSRVADCMGEECGGSWIIDPVLLDAGPQLMILWAQELRGMTALPSRFGEVRIFDGLSDALRAGASEPLECRLLVDAGEDKGPIIAATYQVLGPRGEIVMSVDGLESTGSESLNRLAAASV